MKKMFISSFMCLSSSLSPAPSHGVVHGNNAVANTATSTRGYVPALVPRLQGTSPSVDVSRKRDRANLGMEWAGGQADVRTIRQARLG